MQDTSFPGRPGEQARHIAGLRARALELRGTLRVAGALVQGGRSIDLAGLEEQVGRLCAATLDLTPEAGRALRADLFDLRGDAVALILALKAEKPPA